MWQSLQHLTNYKGNSLEVTHADVSLVEEFNHFFTRFEAERPHLAPPTSHPSSTHLLELQEHQVRGVLKAIKQHKAAGPDGVLGKVLRACADQLSGVLMRIFNTSLKLATIPPCLKAATIVPVPKKNTISGFNDCGPVALTSVVVKCFERLVLHHLKSCLPQNFDQHQFAYKANRSTADAIASGLCAEPLPVWFIHTVYPPTTQTSSSSTQTTLQ